MRNVTVAATQMACTWDKDANVERAVGLVREAAARGANIIQIQELFETPYFPVEEREDGKGIITGVGDFDNLAEAAPELPGAARIRPVFLAFKYERGEGFGDLHRRIAHPRREGSRG